jgi:serine/threonine protein kinase
MATYKFLDPIGGGGFGEVLKAERKDDQWLCAVKKLRVPCDDQTRARFLREVRMQTQLRHPNIVRIIGHNFSDDPPWFVMPLAAENMRTRVKRQFGESELWVFFEIAEGVAFAHDNGVIHRDLKPENVLFFKTANGRDQVAVGDFGLGRFITRDSPSLTATDMRMGTVEYMAPEQYADAKSADGRSDIYALGKMLYETLTGQIPYPSLEMERVPGKYRYIVARACSLQQADRYQSVAALVQDVKLVTEKPSLLTSAAEAVRDSAARLMADAAFSKTDVAPLAKLLAENCDDINMLTRVLPGLPDPILQALVVHHGRAFMLTLKAYDDAVSGGLPFEFCDSVADFMAKVFEWTESDDMRLLVLKRLPRLGQAHNRWHVGEAYARLLAGPGKDLALAARDDLTANPDLAAWCAHYLRKASAPAVVLKALPKASGGD